MFEIILEVRRTGRSHVGPSGLNCLLGDWYPDLTVGAIAWRRFAPEPHHRPEGPLCNSHDRKVVVRDVINEREGPKDRHEFMPALRASIVLLVAIGSS